jgi:hypothetical protein
MTVRCNPQSLEHGINEAHEREQGSGEEGEEFMNCGHLKEAWMIQRNQDATCSAQMIIPGHYDRRPLAMPLFLRDRGKVIMTGMQMVIGMRAGNTLLRPAASEGATACAVSKM